MPTYFDSKGNSYTLNQQIGRGGEGTVFFCPTDLSLVAKIYHEAIDSEKAEKLRWMAENKNDGLIKVAAWVVDVLTDENGDIVGFLMNNVKAKEIHELYSLKSRRIHFPEANWQFLLHTAANVARAFYVLHKHEHIMGDVNHGNCVVLADGTVKLIDCDSYSIKTDKMRYSCDVGVATHLAPELQGKDLSEIEREPNHDNFGLAVIIFQLLFLGRHPFSGNYLGAEDKSLEDCIRERRFAYGNEEITNVKQPPGTLSLTQITPRLALMFERAFLTEDRPEPWEWIEGLEDLSNSLKQCAIHIGHHYFNGLTACPWCEIESKTGLMLFPFVSGAGQMGENAFNIFTVENLLASLDVPQNLPARPFKSGITPPPSEEAKRLQRTNQSRFVIVAMLQFVIVLFLTGVAGAGVGFFIGAILLVGFLVTFHNTDKSNKEYYEDQLSDARRDWNNLESEWDKNALTDHFDSDISIVRGLVTEHHALQQQSRDKINRLNNELFRYKLNSHLASHKIADVKLTGVEAEHQEILKKYGIRTAADATWNRMKYLPMDDEVKQILIDWRKSLETLFEFKPEAELPEAEKNRFEIEFIEKRRKIEKEIEQILVSLRSGAIMIRQNQKMLVSKAETFAQKLLQAESDNSTVGTSTPLTVVLILITTIIPMFGAAFQTKPSNYRTDTSYLNDGRMGNVNIKKAEPIKPETYDDVFVNENITNWEIEKMTTNEREKAAQKLAKQAEDLVAQENYNEAERKLRLSVRFINWNSVTLNSLAEVLYELGNYKESLKFLDKSFEIYPDNETTRILAGKNYIKLRRFSDATEILTKAHDANENSSEINYNLGLAYKGLKNYQQAVNYLYEAVKADETDIDARFELGYCYFKNGDKELAKTVYTALVDLDEEKAEELRRIAGFRKIEISNTNTPIPPSYMMGERGIGSGNSR